jgi:transposase
MKSVSKAWFTNVLEDVPPFSSTIEQALDTQIRDALKLAATPPQQRQKRPQPRWTLKRLVSWTTVHFGIECCGETIRQTLKQLGVLEKSPQAVEQSGY